MKNSSNTIENPVHYLGKEGLIASGVGLFWVLSSDCNIREKNQRKDR